MVYSAWKKTNLVNKELNSNSEKEITLYRDENNKKLHMETNIASGMSRVLAIQPSPLMTPVFLKNMIKCQILRSGWIRETDFFAMLLSHPQVYQPPALISARLFHMQSLYSLAILILPSKQDFHSGTFVIIYIMKSLGLLLFLISDKAQHVCKYAVFMTCGKN